MSERGPMQWMCGGCGMVHGWICPIYGSPGDSERQRILHEGEKKLGRQVFSVVEANQIIHEYYENKKNTKKGE